MDQSKDNVLFTIPEQKPVNLAVNSLSGKGMRAVSLSDVEFVSCGQINYTVTDELLGKGGNGNVYKGYDMGGRAVAVKVVPNALANFSPEYEAMLEKEAKVQAGIKHPNIVEVHDIQKVVLPDREKSGVAVIMEWMDPNEYVTLNRLEKINNSDGTNQRISEDPRVVLRVGSALCKAIDYMAEKGIYHRDIKPSNIFVDYKEISSLNFNEEAIEAGLVEDDSIKLSDFGIASEVLDTREMVRKENGLEVDSDIFGTPQYMSPESAMGDEDNPVDVRSEIFSIGIALYEMLGKKLPFADESPDKILHKIIYEPQSELITDDPSKKDLFDSINPVLKKALQKRKEDRYQSGKEFAEALKQALDPFIAPKEYPTVKT